LRHRLGGGARVGFDLRLQLDGAVGKIVVLERLVGGMRGERRKGKQRGGKAGANERYHEGTLPKGAQFHP